jgi:4-amino-4-deoxy-L-arabinose transferase-like glycosyltransferase
MRSRWHLLTVAGLILAAAGMLSTFDGPFARGWLGHNGARYAHIARNYVRHGLLYERGAPLLDVVGAPVTPHDVYAHHPPGVPMLLSMVFDVTGVSENAARALPALCMLLALLLLGRLVQGAAGPRAAGLAVLAASAMPMVSLYGAHLDPQGPPVLCASLVVLLAYHAWRDGGSLWALLIASACASALDWYGLYAPASCALHLWFTRPDRRATAVGLAAFSIALCLGWLAWLTSLPRVSLETLAHAAGTRGLTRLFEDGDLLALAVTDWLRVTRDLMPGWPLLLPFALCVMAGVVGGKQSRRLAGAGRPQEEVLVGPRGLVGLLLLPPLLHGLLLPAGMLQHGYWLFGLPLGLAAALAIAAQSLRALPAVLAVALLVPAGWAGAGRVLAERNELPALVGQALATHTAPGEVILTTYDVNPFAADRKGDVYVLMHPEVLFYADRAVRGGLETPADLADALDRRPDAGRFLVTPWPRPPDAALIEDLQRRASRPGTVLQREPAVTLYTWSP